MRFYAVLLMCSIGALGCDDGGDGGDGGGVAGSAAFFRQFAEIACARLFECEPGGNPFLATEAKCRAFFGESLAATNNELISRGWAEFDGALANQCLGLARTALQNKTCEELQDGVDDLPGVQCENIFIPKQGPMEPCGYEDENGLVVTQDIVCQDSMACLEMAEGDPVCVVPVAQGEPCEAAFRATPCIKGTYCAQSDDGSTSTCEPVTPIGEACVSFSECGEDAECNEESVCAVY